MGQVRTKLIDRMHQLADLHDQANECAISLLTAAGYDPTDKDDIGESIEDEVQAMLVETFMRAPMLKEVIDTLLENTGQAAPTTGIETPGPDVPVAPDDTDPGDEPDDDLPFGN